MAPSRRPPRSRPLIRAGIFTAPVEVMEITIGFGLVLDGSDIVTSRRFGLLNTSAR